MLTDSEFQDGGRHGVVINVASPPPPCCEPVAQHRAVGVGVEIRRERLSNLAGPMRLAGVMRLRPWGPDFSFSCGHGKLGGGVEGGSPRRSRCWRRNVGKVVEFRRPDALSRGMTTASRPPRLSRKPPGLTVSTGFGATLGANTTAVPRISRLAPPLTCMFVVRPLGFEPRTCGLRVPKGLSSGCDLVGFFGVLYGCSSG